MGKPIANYHPKAHIFHRVPQVFWGDILGGHKGFGELAGLGLLGRVVGQAGELHNLFHCPVAETLEGASQAHGNGLQGRPGGDIGAAQWQNSVVACVVACGQLKQTLVPGDINSTAIFNDKWIVRQLDILPKLLHLGTGFAGHRYNRNLQFSQALKHRQSRLVGISLGIEQGAIQVSENDAGGHGGHGSPVDSTAQKPILKAGNNLLRIMTKRNQGSEDLEETRLLAKDAEGQRLACSGEHQPSASGPHYQRIAIVGDIHDQWSVDDAEALHQLRVDLVLFVGDVGNEAVALVRQIAALEIPKAVILGNHDAWYTATDWGRKKCPYDRTQEDRVAQQLQVLGEAHVGYGKLDLPHLGLSVVGGRPFSWGGSEWKYSRFYQERFAVKGFEASAARIQQAVDATTQDCLLFLGHCGPTGLGDVPEAPVAETGNPWGATLAILTWPSAFTMPKPWAKPFPWLPLVICTMACAIARIVCAAVCISMAIKHCT
jgi:hypothetical protein